MPQKESLVKILSKRLMEERRAELRKDIRKANREFRAVPEVIMKLYREFRAGKCQAVTPAELLREISG